MFVIPAIDIITGECIRLTKGDFKSKKKYGDDPLEIAMKWKNCGAEWLHIVDLDGARYGALKNLKIAQKIKLKTGLKIEYGGGIRDMKSFKKVVGQQIDKAIIGTGALEEKGFLQDLSDGYSDRFILSLDFDSNGAIYKDGWQKGTGLNVFDYITGLSEYGIKEVIITNISRDGTLEGADMKIIKKILDISGMKLIVAGGISDIGDIKKLKILQDHKGGVSGVIIGKALYENRIDLTEAIKIGQG